MGWTMPGLVRSWRNGLPRVKTGRARVLLIINASLFENYGEGQAPET